MLWIVVVLVVAGVIIASGKKQAAATESVQRQQPPSTKSVQTYRQNYDRARSRLVGWVGETAMRVNDRRCLVALSPDGTELAIFHCPDDRPAGEHDDVKIKAISIISADLQNTKKTVRRRVEEKQAVLTQQKKNTVGRALVGGALLGPVGAVAGAASGLNKNTKLNYKTVTVDKMVEVDGVSLLFVGTTDPHQPLLRIAPPDDERGEQLLYRLRAMMARTARAA